MVEIIPILLMVCHIQITDKIHITSTTTDKFSMLEPPATRLCYKFPHLIHHLISVGQLCDENFNVSFDA